MTARAADRKAVFDEEAERFIVWKLLIGFEIREQVSGHPVDTNDVRAHICMNMENQKLDVYRGKERNMNFTRAENTFEYRWDHQSIGHNRDF